ncbi:BCCT family transporter [Rhodovulum sulfidophilum]|uniref:BCCT family transporter n=1 Tax=Rhodovulum sulfidophilum TaxID=35806 RepID=UPI00138958C2|nr:BCCT family transporter [Rhodovulum sulfidophilum]NDK36980.1 BCCT family transporter [Rhodovulum sulfidophilum]
MTERTRTDTQTSLLGLSVDPIVFFTSASLIVIFVGAGVLFTDSLGTITAAVQNFIVSRFGWLYIIVVGAFPALAIYLMLSRFGSVRLGQDDDRPKYSTFAWLSMLYGAGLGIGLVFYGVAEPMLHYVTPPLGTGGTPEAAEQALLFTMFHWGIHPWALYIVLGLAMAYASFRQGLPLTISSTLVPLIGDRANGPIGKAVNILAVFGTLFGLATSLGLGVKQIASGLNFVANVQDSIGLQIGLIALITSLATLSVVAGLDKGIKRLSIANSIFAVSLLAFVIIAGPTQAVFDALPQNLGVYLQNLVGTTFFDEAYRGGDWQAGWTLFYWGWWVSWSPFAGMFIARISRGRTIREFIAGTMIVPSAITLVWFTGFGNGALALAQSGAADMVSAVQDNVSTSLFVLLAQLPMPMISSVLALIVILLFFVTSSDSASFVIDIITSGGAENPPVVQRIFWAVSEGVVAAILLLVGGLGALQTASLATGLPFTIVLVFVACALLRALHRNEGRRMNHITLGVKDA